MVGSSGTFEVVLSFGWVDDVIAFVLRDDALVMCIDVEGASVIVFVVVVGVGDGVVVVVVSGSTSGGSTCMVIDS